MLAFFGSPLPALKAALLIQKRISAFNKQRIVVQHPPFITRIGLVTGPCLLARIGSRDRQEITILGDTVNLASRFQALAPPGGLVMDQATFTAADHPPALHSTVQIRGKRDFQPVYEIEATRLTELQTFLREKENSG